jgi:molybdopterin-guanine dinucleotide biosynthesis adapter protein
MNAAAMTPVFGITGWKDAGKTTLTVRLVEYLTGQGFSVSTIKHAHHSADVDHEGTDSHKHRLAGAKEVLLATPFRYALMHELRGGEEEPSLNELLDRMGKADLILVEGYKREPIPKLMIMRGEDDESAALRDIPNIKAFVHAKPSPAAEAEGGRPAFAMDDIAGIAAFILGQLGLPHGNMV